MIINVNVFTSLLIVCILSSLTSCETRKIKYSGLNDLVVGVQQVVLYENGEFYLELGAGGTEGTYKIIQDTVNLKYYDKPEKWPDQLVISTQYFTTIKTDQHIHTIRIKKY